MYQVQREGKHPQHIVKQRARNSASQRRFGGNQSVIHGCMLIRRFLAEERLQANQRMLDRVLGECYAPTLLVEELKLEEAIELIGVLR